MLKKSLMPLILVLSFISIGKVNANTPDAPDRVSVSGKITEKADGHPIAYAQVVVLKGNAVVTGAIADELGNYEIRNLYPGRYTVEAYLIGFHKSGIDTTLISGHYRLNFALESADITLQGVTVTANSEKEQSTTRKLDIVTDAPQFHTTTYHSAPTNLPSTIIQQNIPGAVQAPTGEVHIRGQHAEYSYNVDGLPVPETQSEGMEELFDPRVIDQISFLVGDLPAKYSDALAVIDVKTKIPATPLSATVSGYAGSFNSSGQSLSFTGHTGNFAYFFAGSRKITDRRIDTPLPDIFHDHGTDLFGLGKIQYILSKDDILAIDLDQSNSNSQVPYDSTGGLTLDDNQKETDGFQNLIYRHGIEADGGTGEFFVGLSHRQGTFNYSPGINDIPSFYFNNDTTAYNISEDRHFDVYGGKSNLSFPIGEELELDAGASYFYTIGTEHFSAFNQNTVGPQSLEKLKGYDFGAHIQARYQPFPVLQFDAGIRYDQHHAQGIGTESQVSPKIKATYIPDVSSSIYVYYGRIFVPVLIEQLREITQISGTVSQPTSAVRGNYFEIGMTHSLSNSLSARLVGYYTQESPGMDDNTIPGTAITTAVNIQHIFVRGAEFGLDYHPDNPLTGYFNLAVSHAQGDGTTSGGFLPALPPTTAFDLDHDQRITYSVGLNYSNNTYFASISGSYGSGLTNGETNGHVNPHLIFNCSLGKTFRISNFSIKPELYINNILNHQYLLKGSFFSGAAWGTPRSFLFKVSLDV
jgi:hypothetical protein